MRPITLNLWANTGTATPGALQVLSGAVEEIADLTQEVDGTNCLSKVTPGDLTCKVLDPDGSIWTFIQTQLTTSTGLLPPWLEMYVGGTRVFLGTLDPARVVNRKAADDWSIEVGAVDWSNQLATTYLGSPTAMPWKPSTAYTVGSQVLNGNSVYKCTVAGTSATSGGPSGVVPPITDGTVTWVYVPPTWGRPVPSIINITSAPAAVEGYSASVLGQKYGLNVAQLNFVDPCTWIYTGAVLTCDQPVYRALLYRAPFMVSGHYSLPALPSEMLPPGTIVNLSNPEFYPGFWQNVAGTWTACTDNGHGVITSKPRAYPTVLDLQLPSTQFPVGTLVADANSGLSGTVYQATAGNTWSTSLTMVNPTTQYKVSSTTDNPSLNVTTAVLSISPWPTTGNWDGFWTANFTLNNPTAQDLDYWLTTVAVPSSPATPCHVLNLNSVSGIAIGDGLMVVDSDSSASFTVAGVDPILNQVSTVEAISNLPLGTHIYWDETSQGDMVLEDPGVILQAAMAPFSVDLSKFTAPSTADPTFGFLPMRPLNGADVQPVGDIEPTLTGLKLSTGATYLNPADGTNVKSYSWTGTPDTGWATPTGSAGAAPNADWTCQLVAAPTSLMPYEVACTTAEFPNGINPFQRLRNRAYSDTVYFQENNGLIIVNNKIINGAYVQTVVGTTITYQYTQNGVTYNSATGDNFTPWSPAWAYLAGALAVYDYQTMKRFIFNGTAQVQAKAWSGTAWGAPTLYTWPGSSCVQSAVPMVGMAGSILAYATDATLANPRLELWGFSGGLTASLSLAAYAGLVGGTLVRTPYGAYLVCGYNLAQITYSAGALHLVLISMAGEVDVLFANTLVARNAGEIAIFGRVQDGDNTECWMFRIFTPFQSTLNNASLWSEKIGEGCPTLMGAMRDPSKPGRIVGHYGGQLWQIDTVRPMCIERFTPGGMTALECVEHVCQAMAAMAIPDANGTMHIISRNPADSPLALTVSQVSVSSTLSWPDFASIVRITSQDSKFYFDAFGQQGGVLLEVGNHPMVWSLSACAGMAESWCAWFGQPRAMSEEEWFYTDPNTGAPWESIQLFTKLSVNGGPNVRLMSRSQNFIAGSATVKTVGA